MKFGTLTQNYMPKVARWSKWKPDVEIQNGGRLFFLTGSSYNSAAD